VVPGKLMVEPKRMSSATTGVMMEKFVRQDGTVTRLEEGGSTPAPRVGGAPDPRLVELVRLLARYAARRWYAKMMEERGQPRS
jgi:hypothetical protein